MSHDYVHVEALASNRPRSQELAEAFERGDTLVLVLADGAGGIRGGEVASRKVVDAVRDAVDRPEFALHDVRAWAELLRATDADLAATRSGETTGLVIALGPAGLVGASAGDSEAWVVTPSQVDDLTSAQHTRRRLGTGRAIPATFERSALAGVLLVATDGLFKQASRDVIVRLVRAHAMGRAVEELVGLVRLPSGQLPDDVGIVLATRKAPLPAPQ
ncbi:MAG TPA: hypothetical protein VIF15_10235 [Polyangiaceae bacterium]|jgi:serine/threonine protein phosphatase PrpC